MVLDRRGVNGELDWSRCAIGSLSVRAVKGGLTEPNPTDRGRLGSKIHVIRDRNGLPLSVGISGANLHDSQALIPLMRRIPPVRSRFGRRRPAELHADKGYDLDHLRGWLRRRQIVRASPAAGWRAPAACRHRWVVERTLSWLNGHRRLHRRYERKADHFLAFVGIFSALICYRRTDQDILGVPPAGWLGSRRLQGWGCCGRQQTWNRDGSPRSSEARTWGN
ncbi:IS5 family transposase [Streptomyces wuyuanensis]|uniref:IS5 family transposase n=1 Tax=Streptomyces wuyuanensis TaxID=1196353 RepID=UPI0036787E98